MTLKRLSPPGLLLTMLLAPSLSLAADAPPTCSAGLPGDVDYQPADQSPLSHTDRTALERLFRALPGHWTGSMTETICLLAGGQREHPHTADLTLDGGRDKLRLHGYHVRQVGKAKRRFDRSLFITSAGLSVDRPSSTGGVEVTEVSSSKLGYRMNYRVTFRLPAVDQGAGQPTPAAVGAQPDVTTPGVGPVQGATNLSSGQPTAPPEAKTVKRSQLREERFTLERAGSGRLRIRQDYYTQGVYTGSSVWDLRKD